MMNNFCTIFIAIFVLLLSLTAPSTVFAQNNLDNNDDKSSLPILHDFGAYQTCSAENDFKITIENVQLLSPDYFNFSSFINDCDITIRNVYTNSTIWFRRSLRNCSLVVEDVILKSHPGDFSTIYLNDPLYDMRKISFRNIRTHQDPVTIHTYSVMPYKAFLHFNGWIDSAESDIVFENIVMRGIHLVSRPGKKEMSRLRGVHVREILKLQKSVIFRNILIDNCMTVTSITRYAKVEGISFFKGISASENMIFSAAFTSAIFDNIVIRNTRIDQYWVDHSTSSPILAPLAYLWVVSVDEIKNVATVRFTNLAAHNIDVIVTPTVDGVLQPDTELYALVRVLGTPVNGDAHVTAPTAMFSRGGNIKYRFVVDNISAKHIFMNISAKPKKINVVPCTAPASLRGFHFISFSNIIMDNVTVLVPNKEAEVLNLIAVDIEEVHGIENFDSFLGAVTYHFLLTRAQFCSLSINNVVMHNCRVVVGPPLSFAQTFSVISVLGVRCGRSNKNFTFLKDISVTNVQISSTEVGGSETSRLPGKADASLRLIATSFESPLQDSPFHANSTVVVDDIEIKNSKISIGSLDSLQLGFGESPLFLVYGFGATAKWSNFASISISNIRLHDLMLEGAVDYATAAIDSKNPFIIDDNTMYSIDLRAVHFSEALSNPAFFANRAPEYFPPLAPTFNITFCSLSKIEIAVASRKVTISMIELQGRENVRFDQITFSNNEMRNIDLVEATKTVNNGIIVPIPSFRTPLFIHGLKASALRTYEATALTEFNSSRHGKDRFVFIQNNTISNIQPSVPLSLSITSVSIILIGLSQFFGFNLVDISDFHINNLHLPPSSPNRDSNARTNYDGVCLLDFSQGVEGIHTAYADPPFTQPSPHRVRIGDASMKNVAVENVTFQQEFTPRLNFVDFRVQAKFDYFDQVVIENFEFSNVSFVMTAVDDDYPIEMYGLHLNSMYASSFSYAYRTRYPDRVLGISSPSSSTFMVLRNISMNDISIALHEEKDLRFRMIQIGGRSGTSATSFVGLIDGVSFRSFEMNKIRIRMGTQHSTPKVALLKLSEVLFQLDVARSVSPRMVLIDDVRLNDVHLTEEPVASSSTSSSSGFPPFGGGGGSSSFHRTMFDFIVIDFDYTSALIQAVDSSTSSSSSSTIASTHINNNNTELSISNISIRQVTFYISAAGESMLPSIVRLPRPSCSFTSVRMSSSSSSTSSTFLLDGKITGSDGQSTTTSSSSCHTTTTTRRLDITLQNVNISQFTVAGTTQDAEARLVAGMDFALSSKIRNIHKFRVSNIVAAENRVLMGGFDFGFFGQNYPRILTVVGAISFAAGTEIQSVSALEVENVTIDGAIAQHQGQSNSVIEDRDEIDLVTVSMQSKVISDSFFENKNNNQAQPNSCFKQNSISIRNSRFLPPDPNFQSLCAKNRNVGFLRLFSYDDQQPETLMMNVILENNTLSVNYEQDDIEQCAQSLMKSNSLQVFYGVSLMNRRGVSGNFVFENNFFEVLASSSSSKITRTNNTLMMFFLGKDHLNTTSMSSDDELMSPLLGPASSSIFFANNTLRRDSYLEDNENISSFITVKLADRFANAFRFPETSTSQIGSHLTVNFGGCSNDIEKMIFNAMIQDFDPQRRYLIVPQCSLSKTYSISHETGSASSSIELTETDKTDSLSQFSPSASSSNSSELTLTESLEPTPSVSHSDSDPSSSRTISHPTPSATQKLPFVPVGLPPETVQMLTATAQSVTGVVSALGSSPATAMTASQAIATLQLLGCPPLNPENDERWITQDPGFAFTLLPGMSVGSPDDGGYHRAGVLSFTALIFVFGVLIGLVMPSEPATQTSKKNEKDEEEKEKSGASSSTQPADELQEFLNNIDKKKKSKKKNQKNDGTPRRGGRVVQFVCMFLLPIVGSWFNTVGMLLTTGNPLDIIVALVPILLLVFVPLVFGARSIYFGTTRVHLKVAHHRNAFEHKTVIPYSVTRSYILKPENLNRAMSPVSYSVYQFLKSDTGRFLVTGFYLWERDEDEEKYSKMKQRQKERKRKEQSSSSTFFMNAAVFSTSLLHAMPKLFTKMKGPERISSSVSTRSSTRHFAEFEGEEDNNDFMNDNNATDEQQTFSSHDKKYSTTLRERLSPFFILIVALSAVISNLFAGISKGIDNKLSFCHFVLVLQVVKAVLMFGLIVYLKPAIVPVQNYGLIFLELCNLVVAAGVLLVTETSPRYLIPEESTQVVAGLQLFTLLSCTAIGVVLVFLKAARRLLLLISKCNAVSKETYWKATVERCPGGLEEALLQVKKDKDKEKEKQKEKEKKTKKKENGSQRKSSNQHPQSSSHSSSEEMKEIQKRSSSSSRTKQSKSPRRNRIDEQDQDDISERMLELEVKKKNNNNKNRRSRSNEKQNNNRCKSRSRKRISAADI